MSGDGTQTGLEIAVIGMSGRFPGANSTREFWSNLENGVEAITFFSEEELIAEGCDPGEVKRPGYIKSSSGMEHSAYFDADFFQYTPTEAEIMTPQIRIFHECAWEALEDAGYCPDSHEGSIGVYAGASPGFLWQALSLLTGKNDRLGSYAASHLNDKDYLSLRVSYKFNLSGPAIALNTACSTSLVAIHLACQGLLNGECDLTLAGGICVVQLAKSGYFYEEGMIRASDGHCRAFDAKADGCIGGQGAAIVVLKRLAEAIEDRDPIYAVVKGSAINNDGMRKVGFTAPSIKGQAEVIKTALHMAEVDSETISYVETHGTGTALGDPVEIEALKLAFNTDKKGFCRIGSVKSNMGHLDAAAGVTGFIKTVLALHHKLIPPSLHFEHPNPKIDFENSPFYVNTTAVEWKNNGHPLRAGVSSFGIGGTNAHMILEEAPVIGHSSLVIDENKGERKYRLILLSAKTETALDKMTENLAEYINNNLLNPGNHENPTNPGPTLADAAFTLQVGRKRLPYRKMLVCTNPGETVQLLTEKTGKGVSYFFSRDDDEIAPIIFLFPGQGSQYVGMGLGLYQEEPVFRQEMDRCFEIVNRLTDFNIKEILYPADPVSEVSEANSPAPDRFNRSNKSNMSDNTHMSPIDQTEVAQPLLFIIEYALARLLMRWGITPDAMMGHSIGEYTAACLAGVFTLEEALALVTLRGKLMQQMPPGAMLSVPLPEEELVPLLNEQVELAAVNAPALCVVTGSTAGITDFEKELNRKGYDCSRLHTSHAFHSRMMEPILAEFAEQAARIKANPLQIPYISNLTGKKVTPGQIADPHYWSMHLRQPVRFSEGVQELLKTDGAVFLEVGPGRVLSTLVKKHLSKTKDKQPAHHTLELVRHPGESTADQAFLLEKLGQLWLYDRNIDWQGYYSTEKRRRIHLPPYPFEGKYYYPEAGNLQTAIKNLNAQSLANKKADITDWFYIPSWRRSRVPSGKISGKSFPGTCLLFIEKGKCPLGTRLQQTLEQQGAEIIVIEPGPAFTRKNPREYLLDPGEENHYETLISEIQAEGKTPHTIIHMWGVTGNGSGGAELQPGNIEKILETVYYSLLNLARAIGKRYIEEKIFLTVMADHMQEVIGEPLGSPVKAVLLGPVKVIPKEYPNFTCRSIDVVPPAPGSPEEERLVNLVAAELKSNTTETVIAYRSGIRWVRAYDPIGLEKPPQASPHLKENGVYLVTGGLGGIGLELAQYLAQQVKAKLLLIGRTPFPPPRDRDQWLDTHPSGDDICGKIRKIRELEAAGAEVLVLTADVSHRQQLQEAVEEAEQKFGPIDGVIHSAGVPDAGLIQARTREASQHVFAAKIMGTVNLDAVLEHRQLDFFLLCSSLASQIAPPGQVAYISANSFLDAFACYKTSRDTTPITSIDWDAWQEVGMAVKAREQLENAMDMPPDTGILPGEGKEIFARILGETLPQVLISTSDLGRRLEQAEKENIRDLLIHTGKRTPVLKQKRPDIKTLYAEPVNELETTIAILWEEFLGIDLVGSHDNFFDLGASSLDILTINRKLKEILKRDISIVALYNYPTVAELAGYLSRGEDEMEKEEPDSKDLQLEDLQKGKNKLIKRKKRMEE